MAVVKNLMVRSGADFSQLYNEMNKAQKKVSLFKTTIGKTLKGLGLAFSGVAVGKLVTDFTKTAMRTEVLDVAMKSVARASGYATQALQEHRKAVMDMGIAEQEASQILTRFMQAQLDTADAAKLARVAQDAAVIAGMDSSQAAEQMTEAIAKQRPILLSAFGMTKNMNEIYKDHAKTLGKTAGQLTTAEKKQAMLNHILKEGEKIAGTYEASMGVVGKQISSLPRYWHTLQNAIATPLALPGLSVAVEGITNALKNAISWAEANKNALQRWGQSIAGVVRTVVKGFSLITGAITENWQAIKFVGTTLLSYIAITKTAAAATTAWRIATLTLKGELMTKVPVLTAVSTAIGTYRLQMALAPTATNIFTAALLRLRVALYAVHTALGPIGWAILAISAAVSGGMALWNKYNQSLQKTASLGFGDFRTAQDGLAKSTGKAADASEDQADAIEKAGKAAKKSLAGFDEIHQLQKDMAGGGGAGEDILDEFDLGGIGGIGGGIPGLDTGDLMADIEQIKPTLKGFWEWIKQGAGNLWDGVKVKWQVFKDWVANSWAGQLWQGIKDKWSGFKTWAGNLWDSVKIKWDNFKTNIQQKWNAFWEPIKTRWNSFKSWAGELLAPVRQKWNSFVTWARGIWDGLLKKWNEIKSWPLWKWISDKVNWLKNVFNFSWSLPKIKLPRFSVSWSTSGLLASVGKFLGMPGIPRLSVTWLAKGGLITAPMVAGLGEAGREAVIPLDTNTGWADIMADRLVSALQRTQVAGAGVGGDVYVYIGNEQVDAYIYRSQDRRNIRSNGR